MLTVKKVTEAARKWQKLASRGKRRISDDSTTPNSGGTPKVVAIVGKGHFAAYAADGKRFIVPLAYLHRPVFIELLNMAEEEFGLSIDGALTFPCAAELVDYAMSLAGRDVPCEVEEAFMSSLRGSCSKGWSSPPLSEEARPIFNSCALQYGFSEKA